MSVKKRNRGEKRTVPAISRALMLLVMFFVLFALLSAAITPDRYDIQVGQPAPNTIKASKDVEDIITTERLRSEAAAAVRSVYFVDESVKETVLGQLNEKFAAISQVSSLALPSDSDMTDAQLASANALLAPMELLPDQLKALSNTDETTLSAVFARAYELAERAMDDNLRESQMESCVQGIVSDLTGQDFDETLVSVAASAVSSCLMPNYFYDEASTEAARQAERDKVETVSRIKGEVIVSDGEIVTEAQYKMLDSLGIVKESSLDISLYYGVALLVILLLSSVTLYMKLFAEECSQSFKTLLLLCLVFGLVLGASLLARQANPYLMPTTLGVLLISQLVNRRVSVYFNIIIALVVSLFTTTATGSFNMANFTVFASALMSGNVALFILRARQHRTSVLLAGLAIAGVNMVCTFAVGLINNTNLSSVLTAAEWSAASGILSAVLCVACMPILEWMFNIVTTSKLIELSNPNQPLLRRLLLEAPGTYHHSIVVANLAEAAANEVKANSLLARVGAYYHDVGKLKRPSYFKENQMGDNPHDRTDPRVSTAILTAHPRDGAQFAKAERLPEPIIDIIRSHHGDTPVLYFYNKSVQENGEDVNIDDFRYEGPRPATREAAIVMLADTVEAAARSLPNPDAEKLSALIRKLVKQKLDDGQLDQCDLTFRDVSRICASFMTVLSGVFHERIEYPSIEIPKKQLKAAPPAKAPAEETHAENAGKEAEK